MSTNSPTSPHQTLCLDDCHLSSNTLEWLAISFARLELDLSHLSFDRLEGICDKMNRLHKSLIAASKERRTNGSQGSHRLIVPLDQNPRWSISCIDKMSASQLQDESEQLDTEGFERLLKKIEGQFELVSLTRDIMVAKKTIMVAQKKRQALFGEELPTASAATGNAERERKEDYLTSPRLHEEHEVIRQVCQSGYLTSNQLGRLLTSKPLETVLSEEYVWKSLFQSEWKSPAYELFPKSLMAARGFKWMFHQMRLDDEYFPLPRTETTLTDFLSPNGLPPSTLAPEDLTLVFVIRDTRDDKIVFASQIDGKSMSLDDECVPFMSHVLPESFHRWLRDYPYPSEATMLFTDGLATTTMSLHGFRLDTNQCCLLMSNCHACERGNLWEGYLSGEGLTIHIDSSARIKFRTYLHEKGMDVTDPPVDGLVPRLVPTYDSVRPALSIAISQSLNICDLHQNTMVQILDHLVGWSN